MVDERAGRRCGKAVFSGFAQVDSPPRRNPRDDRRLLIEYPAKLTEVGHCPHPKVKSIVKALSRSHETDM